MKTLKKQKIISFIVLSASILVSCATTKNIDENVIAPSNSVNAKFDSNDAYIQQGLDNGLQIIEDENQLSRSIIGIGQKNQTSLCNFFMSVNKDISKRKVKKIAKYYIQEAKAEGINSDVAFVQMCLETNFLRYGNLVTIDMNNFCGLGSIDENNIGESFKTMQLGVRAHIQHLQAYSTTEDVPLNKALVDPRYNYVHRTKYVSDIYGLAGAWATDKAYGEKLNALLSRLQNY